MSIKWGVLGLGKIANEFCKDLLLIEGCELHAVGSRSKDKAEKFGQQYGASKSYGSYDELLADNELDIVYIATPHNSHRKYAIQAMNSGVAVLCEKPLAVNFSEVEEILKTAKENKVFLMEALWSRFNPNIQQVMDKIKKGEIGVPTYMNASFSFHKDIDHDHRLFNPDLAGGSILDIGIYPAFLSCLIFGLPNSIAATGKLSAHGVDLQMSAMLDYDYTTVQIMSGLLSDCDMIVRIFGTEGKILIHDRWHEAQSYEVQKKDKHTIFKNPTIGRGYSHEILECNKCLQEGKLESELWSHQDSQNLMSILDELRRQVGVVYPFEE